MATQKGSGLFSAVDWLTRPGQDVLPGDRRKTRITATFALSSSVLVVLYSLLTIRGANPYLIAMIGMNILVWGSYVLGRSTYRRGAIGVIIVCHLALPVVLGSGGSGVQWLPVPLIVGMLLAGTVLSAQTTFALAVIDAVYSLALQMIFPQIDGVLLVAALFEFGFVAYLLNRNHEEKVREDYRKHKLEMDQSLNTESLYRMLTELKARADELEAKNTALQATNEELVKANIQVNEASRIKSEFLAMVSHELRTPLNVVIGNAQLMANHMIDESEYETTATEIWEEGERQLVMINDLLDFTKLEAKQMRLVLGPHNPTEVIEKAVSALRSTAESKGIAFKLQISSDAPQMLMCDDRKLSQVVRNLVTNAIKFTDQGSIKVAIDAECAGDAPTWSIVVTDTGIGIPEGALESIFDVFRQVDGSDTREHGGMGLGLAIVRELVTLMKGKVEVKSRVGEGSQFTVTLPQTVDTKELSVVDVKG